MGKAVGLFRAIKPEWLNKTADLVIGGYGEVAIKTTLDEYLSFEIKSEINRRKTRELLMNIWARPEATSPIVHTRAINAYRQEQSDRIALSWALFVLAHPLFADISGLIGKVSNIQGTFTTAWLKEKICAMHGERPTLLRALTGVLETLRLLGCLCQEKIGTYRVVKHSINDDQTIGVLILSLLVLGKKAYYEISALHGSPYFFPFEFAVKLEQLHFSDDFTLEAFGGKTVLAAMKED